MRHDQSAGEPEREVRLDQRAKVGDVVQAWDRQPGACRVEPREFVAPEAYRSHYETVAARIAARLEAGEDNGDVRAADPLEREIRAWASMGMNVFLGLRFAVWGNADPEEVAAIANRILRDGIKA